MRTVNRYAEAARKYKPDRTRVLFVAEAPPNSIERYFYYEDVTEGDWLWIALMKTLYGAEWGRTKEERPKKEKWLNRFRGDRFQLIDAVKKPIFGSPAKQTQLIRSAAAERISEIKEINPEQVVLIKRTVHDALYADLKKAGVPVVNAHPLPFPSSGRQKQFQDEFRGLVDNKKPKL